MPLFNSSVGGVSPKKFDEFKNDLLSEWGWLIAHYDYETKEELQSNQTTKYTTTIKNGEETIATRVSIESADGRTITQTTTIGEEQKTRVFTENDDGQWTVVFSA